VVGDDAPPAAPARGLKRPDAWARRPAFFVSSSEEDRVGVNASRDTSKRSLEPIEVEVFEVYSYGGRGRTTRRVVGGDVGWTRTVRGVVAEVEQARRAGGWGERRKEFGGRWELLRPSQRELFVLCVLLVVICLSICRRGDF
jgi:hypothetical protein